PNIVQIFDIGEYEGRPYFSLELVEDGSLDRKLRGTPLAPTAAARLVEQVAQAMHYAHQKGVVHRDLKPANILLAGNPKSQEPKHKQIEKPKDSNPKPAGQGVSDLGPSDLGFVGDLGFEIWNCPPKVSDFGLAKQLDVEHGQTLSGEVMGTPSYMAPEQVAGET